jgi:hypothetical protein
MFFTPWEIFFSTVLYSTIGFGSFMWFCVFAVFFSAAIYISPMFCGSNLEKKMLSKPQEIETS